MQCLVEVCLKINLKPAAALARKFKEGTFYMKAIESHGKPEKHRAAIKSRQQTTANFPSYPSYFFASMDMF